jgi:diphosphomevalonate decarboxylase
MHWLATAPANIALIKYMGKKEVGSNLPDNPSLSYTLNNLKTMVRIESTESEIDSWQPLDEPGYDKLALSSTGQSRFLKHLQFLKDQFEYKGNFLIRSGNNFPLGSGLASSASSFAALTRCAVKALSELTETDLLSNDEQAKLSRLGSGSSCRSFYEPWALWNGEEVHAITLPYHDLVHQVIVINKQEKKISSSEAHQRVKTSDLYSTRPARANANLKQLLEALKSKNWPMIYKLCWDDFQDMHQLFSTCKAPFTYMTEETHAILDLLQNIWRQFQDGPIITMDAGPNIHLLYRADQKELADQFKIKHIAGHYDVL